MKINFYLKNANSTKPTPIIFQVQSGFYDMDENGKKTYKKIRQSTGENILPKFWNEKNQKVRTNFENHNLINSKLIEFENFLIQLENEYIEKNKILSIEILKQKIDVYFNGEKKEIYDFYELAEYLAQNKTQKLRQRNFIQSIKILKEFSKVEKYHISFETITIDFYNRFVKFLNKKDFSINYIGKHIKNIKHVLNEGFVRKLHNNLDFKNSKFKAPTEKISNIYLNDAEINILYNLDLSNNPRLEKVRDAFLVGCYTGLRFSDFTQIKPENIDNNILTIKTKKTGKLVKIPLKPEAKQILLKYQNFAPKPISNQKMNDYLKEVSKLANFTELILKYKSKGVRIENETRLKYELVCTHTARRSFATNCYKNGIPAKQIMLITGHTTETEFFKYIQINETENAEMLLQHDYFKSNLKVV